MATSRKATDEATKPAAAKKVASKTARAKPVAVKAAAKASTRAKPSVAAKTVLKASTAPKPVLSAEQRNHYVSVAAFYIAERRGFTLGDPAQDWLDAEAEIDRLVTSGHFFP